MLVGSRTIRSIIEGTWHLTEYELEAVYHKAPMPIRQYVRQVTTEPNMPSMQEIIRPVEPYSMEAKQAYIFLSESALRAVYGMMYEPAYIWKVVSLYDDEPVTTFGWSR